MAFASSFNAKSKEKNEWNSVLFLLGQVFFSVEGNLVYPDRTRPIWDLQVYKRTRVDPSIEMICVPVKPVGG